MLLNVAGRFTRQLCCCSDVVLPRLLLLETTLLEAAAAAHTAITQQRSPSSSSSGGSAVGQFISSASAASPSSRDSSRSTGPTSNHSSTGRRGHWLRVFSTNVRSLCGTPGVTVDAAPARLMHARRAAGKVRRQDARCKLLSLADEQQTHTTAL